MSYAILLPLLFLLFRARRSQREFPVAWQYRHIFSANIYWGIPFLYVLSGASLALIALCATRFEMPISSAPMQIFTVLSLLSMGAVHLLARKFATPVFDAEEVSQRDRNYVHSFWGMFWLLGLAVGLLALLIPAAH